MRRGADVKSIAFDSAQAAAAGQARSGGLAGAIMPAAANFATLSVAECLSSAAAAAGRIRFGKGKPIEAARACGPILIDARGDLDPGSSTNPAGVSFRSPFP